MPYRASIIVVSYNNFDSTTGPCLNSLLEAPDNDQFEIVVIDNASSDGTPEMLLAMAEGRDNLRLLLNNENRGWGGGTNDGAKIARGEILILLNSDTVVPAGALARLCDLQESHPDWGLVGPVTNAAGTEQKIFTEATTPAAIIKEGEEWCRHALDSAYASERLDFYCLAIRKNDFNTIGGLDEAYGLGYFEDTDFSLRAKAAGLSMMVVEEVFVYHRGSESFSKLKKKFVKKLMRTNRRKLEKKYPGQVKLYHLRERNTHVMQEYVRRQHSLPAPAADLNYLFDNRMRLARTIFPNNPLKKIVYSLQLRRLKKGFYR